ncbi:J domain-containing protein [Vitreimonas flagellata]|uniref:J domain-containing protein n=1 Tax=Vitreimonas flagellata TaxID=2560861 RepID=UPI001075716A|nr:J domain-containing protein [Vitreimonas flagellata]
MTQAYPLAWPDGWPRTPKHRQTSSRFKVTQDRARRNLLDQLRMLGATQGRTVISSDVAVRQDGQPYADQARRLIHDPGVAVYFELDGKAMVMACDLYTQPFENMHALGHAIEHLRGLDRHGGGHMIERAFTGFQALPPPSTSERTWWDVLECTRDASIDVIRAQHRRLLMDHHPDRGGSDARMAEINRARDKAMAERSIRA